MTASPIFCSSDFLAETKKIGKTLSNTGCLSLSSRVSGLVTFSLQQSNVRAISAGRNGLYSKQNMEMHSTARVCYGLWHDYTV